MGAYCVSARLIKSIMQAGLVSFPDYVYQIPAHLNENGIGS